MSILNNDEIPVGLSMAFAENLRAMERFGNMDEQGRRDVIERAKHASSKQEMRSIVSELNEME